MYIDMYVEKTLHIHEKTNDLTFYKFSTSIKESFSLKVDKYFNYLDKSMRPSPYVVRLGKGMFYDLLCKICNYI
jgi:hypothetical protein